MSTDPNPNPPPVVDDPSKAELDALRKEKADREAADKAAADQELADLKAYKAAQEAKRPPVKAPTPRVEKEPVTPPATTVPAMRVRKRGKGGAARSWFGPEDDE